MRLFHPADSPPLSWQRHAARLFRERMLGSAPPFPCVFGVDAVRRGTLRFGFLPAGTQRTAMLAHALTVFLEVAKLLGPRTSLVCFFEQDPTLTTLADYERHFWSLLQGLIDLDDTDWPAGVDLDPESPTWEFSFHGVSLFVVVSTPAHRRRRSRHFEYFTVTFQPRFVFDDLAPSSPRGQNARRIIRRRVVQYDDVPLSPYLDNFGAPQNREWVQYHLDDDNRPLPPIGRCPIDLERRKQDRTNRRD